MTGRHSADRRVPHQLTVADTVRLPRIYRPPQHRAKPNLIAALAWPGSDTARLLRVVRRG